MISTIKAKAGRYLDLSNDRSKKIAKNVIFSFIVKVLNIVVALLLIPMTIDYVNPIQYGIWLTLSSIVGWMSFFDVGLGNGLRNKLTYSLALNQITEAKKYVSTTYAAVAIISLILFIFFYLINPNINWRSILNVPPSVPDDISFILLVALSSFCLRFVVQVFNTILIAIHETFKSALNLFLGQLGVLVVIFILKKTVPGNLLILVVVLTAIPILVTLIASVYYYTTRLKFIAPSLSSIDSKYAKSILNVGGSFFVIQVGAMVLFQTDNIIIAKVIGPEAVTEFNVAYKLFSVVLMIFTIIISPYWSAFTDAYAKHDFDWMKKQLKLMRKICLFLSLLNLLVWLTSKYLFYLWIGNRIIVHSSLSISLVIYVIIYMWQSLHVYLLNGIGKIRLQLILVVISALINIPLSIFLARSYGLAGVVWGNTLVFIIMSIVFHIQAEKIITKKSSGIWDK